jgi:hypothetical protein
MIMAMAIRAKMVFINAILNLLYLDIRKPVELVRFWLAFLYIKRWDGIALKLVSSCEEPDESDDDYDGY